MLKVATEQALGLRVRRQGLAERAPAQRMLEVASSICGLHAQVMSSAELTLWARVDGLDRTAVAEALWEERTLVKTWAMRGTLHLLPAKEYGLWQAALSTEDRHNKKAWLKAFGMTGDDINALIAAIGEALDGDPLTREELAEYVADATGRENLRETVLESWGSALKPAAFQGNLCFAPSDGQRVRFVNPRAWLGTIEPARQGEALAEVARRYLTAHGPATREDLARWWGVSAANAGRMLKAIEDELTQVEVEGVAAWMLRADVDELGPEEVVRLLPAFDQWTVGASRSFSEVIPSAQKERIYRQAGWLSPLLLVDGRMAGVWRHERKGKRLLVSIEPFSRAPARVKRAAENEVERLADFLGGELELSWS